MSAQQHESGGRTRGHSRVPQPLPGTSTRATLVATATVCAAAVLATLLEAPGPVRAPLGLCAIAALAWIGQGLIGGRPVARLVLVTSITLVTPILVGSVAQLVGIDLDRSFWALVLAAVAVATLTIASRRMTRDDGTRRAGGGAPARRNTIAAWGAAAALLLATVLVSALTSRPPAPSMELAEAPSAPAAAVVITTYTAEPGALRLVVTGPDGTVRDDLPVSIGPGSRREIAIDAPRGVSSTVALVDATSGATLRTLILQP